MAAERRWTPGIEDRTMTSISRAFEICFQLFVCSTIVSGVTVSGFTDFSFTTEPSDAIGYKGSSLRIDCAAHHGSGSVPSIQWNKDGEIITFDRNNRRRQLRSNGSLYISDVEHSKISSDGGVYQCSATVNNTVTILSRKANIQIAYISRNFRQEPQDVEVYLTDTAMFQCEIDGVPRPNVTWLKDNRAVVDQTGKFRTYPNGVLQIYDVEFRDFGNYFCSAEGTDKVRRSSVAKLIQRNVEEGFQGIKPNFTLKPQDTKAVVRSKVVLFCGAYGLDSQMQPPSIIWLKDRVTIDFTKTQGRLTMIGGGNLQILNVEVTDDGVYMCRAENNVDSIDAEARLTVLVPPSFVKRPQNTKIGIKRDVGLECEVAGKPIPKVTFFKNGRPVDLNDYFEIVNGTSLKILGLIQSDSGYYQCFAENEVGNIQSGAQLQVVDQESPFSYSPSAPSITYHLHRSGAYPSTDPDALPSAPTNLKAAITSTRFVTLSWGVPSQPGPAGPSEIMAYSIHWQELGSERERVMNVTANEANIQRLKPNTQYKFEVRAYNRYGPGLEVATLRLTTEQEVDVPSEAQNLQAIPLSPTSIEVIWEAPLNSKGALQHYSLIYYPVGAQEEKQVTIPQTELRHVLTDLMRFQEYSFRIVAYNNNGPGMSTEEVVARTYSDVPSDVPSNFTLETASSTSIVVRWQPPTPEHRNGQITGYKIRYKKSGGRRGSTVTTDGNRDLYALTDLKKNTEYQVRISAQTVNGSGPATEWKYARTYEDDLDESQVPDIPDRLIVRALSTSLVVQWVPNRRSKVLVRGYYLGYGKGVPDVYRQVFDADTFFYTIESLQPASEYVVTIRAFNNRGEGQQRYETVFTSEETTEEPVTPMLPPIGLKAIVLSANTIVVTWTDDSLGKIQRITDSRYYTVRYNTVPSNRGRFKYINSTDLNCHIDDLKPAMQYEFSVKVIKGRRQSTWSMSVINVTQEDAPGSVPRDLTLVRVEGDPLAVTLNWQPPQKPNGQITGYLVFYTTDQSQDDRNWVLDGVVGESLSRTIKDLTEDTNYYFKVQARNSKGYGPMSATKMYRTPKLRGGPRHIPKPDDTFTNYDQAVEGDKEEEEKGGEISQNVLIIIIACVVGVTFCIVGAIVTVILCRKREAAMRNKPGASMYKGSPTKNKATKQVPPREGQPPDLWIDHNPIEMKNMANDERSESALSIAISTRRNSHDSKCDTLPRAEVYHSGSEAEERLLPPQYHQLPPQQQRNIIRPKPLMLPVDSQSPHPRDPVATVAAYPNGHLMQRYTQAPMPVSPSEDSGVVPMRPVYPRTQYQMQYGAQGPPRVNAGDISQPSSMHGYPMEIGYRLVPCIEEDEGRYHDTLDESLASRVGYGYVPDLHNRGTLEKTPMGIASPVVSSEPHNPSQGQGRPVNPLKSFSVPEPPGQIPRTPGTPNTPKHIVKPQQTASPYKKPAPPISSGPIKPRSPMPIITPKAPDVTLKPGKEENPDLQKSLSTEELTAEMANLEGLMKDLNAITQQDFEC